MSEQDPADYLRELGEAGDGPHDIARAALMLSALDHSGRAIAPYEAHLAEIADAAHGDSRLAVHIEDGARALSALMVGRYGYDGDRLSYDDPQNADMMAVMTQRRIRHVPIIESGRIVGVISIGDVVKARIDDAELEVESLRGYVAGMG